MQQVSTLPGVARRKRPEDTRLPRLNVEVYPEERELIRRLRVLAAEREVPLHDMVMGALALGVEVLEQMREGREAQRGAPPPHRGAAQWPEGGDPSDRHGR
jgi:hypothetical protein